ncbi:MAG TPA: lipopolysaccharide kinase InaA family protein [Myxococcota bacterium]|nr:lipopolysaccharide kinase InaA family protein [Myxococcota bacterium]
MSAQRLAALAAELASGSTPDGVTILKRNRARVTARAGDAVLKVYLQKPETAAREARALARAHALGVDVPELLAQGESWTATRWQDARPAARGDLPLLLRAIGDAHARGMLHGDLHLGNLLVRGDRALFLDLQRARFLPWIPPLLRRRELGFFAYSLLEPLPPELEGVRFWRDRRAQRRWRSRTARCLAETGGFTAFVHAGERGFRRRDADAAALAGALAALPGLIPLKSRPNGKLYRRAPWMVKEFAHAADAKRAWVGGNGLEARGIATCRPLAWAGRFLVMEDGGATLSDWVDAEFAKSGADDRAELARALGGLLAQLHGRGVYHADLKANNVVWRPGEPPRLLDYGRVRFGARVSRRRRVKNLAQLNAALPDLVPAGLREDAFARYLAASGARADATALRRDVIAESLRRAHRWSGC